MRFVSLFAGAGGLDLGLEYAGWRCEYASDLDPQAVETLTTNQGKRTKGIRALADAVVDQADVRALSGSKILKATGRRKGDYPLLAGGPPCQSWSSAGHQLGFADPRGRLFEDYIRIARQLDVRWLLFENVRGLVTARGIDGVPGSALKAIRDALFNAGWQTQLDLLNAADFGVPQRRVRLILIGYRFGDPPPLPQPAFAENEDIFRRKWRTLGQCLGQLRPPSQSEVIVPSGRLASELATLSPGTGVKSSGKREATRPGGHWGYKQGAFVADPARPARTITANSQQDWIVDAAIGMRRLSPRECAAIQSFPKSWTFMGSRSDQYRLIGNAVPPLLAQAIGEALMGYASRPSLVSPENSSNIAPLPPKLEAAIRYTQREEARNGESRRVAVPRRRRKVA